MDWLASWAGHVDRHEEEARLVGSNQQRCVLPLMVAAPVCQQPSPTTHWSAAIPLWSNWLTFLVWHNIRMGGNRNDKPVPVKFGMIVLHQCLACSQGAPWDIF